MDIKELKSLEQQIQDKLNNAKHVVSAEMLRMFWLVITELIELKEEIEELKQQNARFQQLHNSI